MGSSQERSLCHKSNLQASAQNIIQLPQQGSRSILPQANRILGRAWKIKQLPPLIKTFRWRLIRRALSTAERAARFSSHTNDHCATCAAIEDDAHLFFHCQPPQAVWFSFSPPIHTDTLPQENDGVQEIMQTLISDAISDNLICKILTTLWYIWKARNDKLFHQKTWTPIQVHNAAAAHLNTHIQAILPQAATTASETAAQAQIAPDRQPVQTSDPEASGDHHG